MAIADENQSIVETGPILRVEGKYAENLKIATLNINSLSAPGKFEGLQILLSQGIDILVVNETKLDDSFPSEQFIVDGFKTPYRLDRNRTGGGIIIYVRHDIPSKALTKFKLPDCDKHGPLEWIFLELRLKESKWLFMGGYSPPSQNNAFFINSMTSALDFYSSYDNFFFAGDFNTKPTESAMEDFLFSHEAKNLVQSATCFKSETNPSIIDLLITNRPKSVLKCVNICTGLSDFHEMPVAIFKTKLPKVEPKVISYRDFKRFVPLDFNVELYEQLSQYGVVESYDQFETEYLKVLNRHAPLKQKTLRGNGAPYVTKTLRKAIMTRSRLERRYHMNKTDENYTLFKKQRNFVSNLYKKERKKFYKNLDTKLLSDSKKFWKNIKPFLSDKCQKDNKIILIEDDDQICTDDTEICEKFNTLFKSAVSGTLVPENPFLINSVLEEDIDPVDRAIKKYSSHPSILSIRKNVQISTGFCFSRTDESQITDIVNKLNKKKKGMSSSIPTDILKMSIHVVASDLAIIWNNEIVSNGIFPNKLKLADITPVHKKLEKTLKANYRNVSILPSVSKVFEKLMGMQIGAYMEQYLSKFLCGFRKGYNTQHALITLIEKWKKFLEKKDMRVLFS